MNCRICLPDAMLKNCKSFPSVYLATSASLRPTLIALVDAYPSIRDYLFDEDMNLRRFVNVFVDGVDVRQLQGLDTDIEQSHEVTIIMAVAGG